MPEYDPRQRNGQHTTSVARDAMPADRTQVPPARSMNAQLQSLAPDFSAAIGHPDHKRLTGKEREDIVNKMRGDIFLWNDMFQRALNQIEMDKLLAAAKNTGLASSLIDLIFLIPLGTPIKVAWAAANIRFSAPHLTGAASALSGKLLAGARSRIKIDRSKRYKSPRAVLDMFSHQTTLHLSAVRGMLDDKNISDVNLVAIRQAYDLSRAAPARLRESILKEMALYRDVVETAGKAGSDFELIRAHVYTRTKPIGRGAWPLWLAQRDGQKYRLVRKVPARMSKQSLDAHQARFAGAEPVHTVATARHGHSLHPGVMVGFVDDVFKKSVPKYKGRYSTPPTPTVNY